MSDNVRRRFGQALDALRIDPSDRCLVACSGGGDSVALLHLVVEAFGPKRVCVATVDHHLRDVTAELDLVAAQAQGLGIDHAILDWHWDGTGNLQAAARDARFELLLDHADAVFANRVFLGHTKDDQAETFLMRLARGSGVDGLSAMDPCAPWDRIARPLLDLSRSEIRDWLRDHAIPWCEDPSNDDTRFDRVKARAMMAQLSELGLSIDRLATTAQVMRDEHAVLSKVAWDFARDHAEQQWGDLLFDFHAYQALFPATRHRVLSGVVRWFNGSPYRPRRAELDHWHTRILGGKPAPLAGVLARSKDGRLRFYREAAAVAPKVDIVPGVTTHWDRWSVASPAAADGFSIGALGPELAKEPRWQAVDLPKASLETSPALWHKGAFVGLLNIAPPEGWTAALHDWRGKIP